MQILRAADRVATPWKNGGGVTREVAAWPPGAGMDDFDWRVSLADVAADGPFSAFPDVDRVLTVIDGEGLVLELEGQETLLQTGAPFAFPGEARVIARLTAGPIRDLNVMVRRGAWSARVEPWRGEPLATSDGPSLVVLLEDAEDFAALDVVLLDANETVTLDLPPTTRALTVALRAISPTIG
ncbi:HutD/Ves family protein [Caulobacter soli]|uniref:HutD/Ves family protein n=1 Tax=Caulobacter soli TaxID=2708539 RepID=UPI0013EA28BA|nr:HutD family protein [Caulobacter soli]